MTSRMNSLQNPAPAARPGHFHYRGPGPGEIHLRPYDGGHAALRPLSLPLPATGSQAARILVIDDLHTTRPLLHLLHSLGYCATRATSSGETALQLAQDFLPSIVLLALQLQQMSAYHVAARLRDQAAGQELRLIALTDDFAHTDRELAREAGFERYLVKPVDVSTLQHLLRAKQR